MWTQVSEIMSLPDFYPHLMHSVARQMLSTIDVGFKELLLNDNVIHVVRSMEKDSENRQAAAPEEGPKSVSIRLSPEMLVKLDKYKDEHHLDNRSAALRHILRSVLEEF